ncbi:class I SAM-dependent methyltransferase [Halopiger goleimassiliensis]|uniref:class I SAM-dependent methyltransferase n=1 Tax=Halopiger goleimassiliensis TaxID=1293048 RepID=UPI000B290B75|nr:class I SAM-dependent methyltransferase [Halopiger goleimassiliensis]
MRSDDTAVAPILESVLETLPPGRALDLATGTGRNAVYLADRGWRVDALDISRTQLERARERAAERGVADGIEWLLADADRHAFPEKTYDLVTISFFDALDRLPAVKCALAPGGVLVYEHYLESATDGAGPGDRFRFAPNELLSACADLRVLYYAETAVDGEPHVTLVGRIPTADGSDGLPSLAALE